MKYVVAVSGGVDSMALLHMLATGAVRLTPAEFDKPNSGIVVAHFDHGIREDSVEDAQLVGTTAKAYGFEYEMTRAELGEAVSEDAARRARYQWLNEVMTRHTADTLITAHHQDDVLETICINIVRGTRWRGLCSLREHQRLRRPLLGMSKVDIIRYAVDHEVAWREDSTNDDVSYLRNYIRHLIIPRMTPGQRRSLVMLWRRQAVIADEIEVLSDELTGVAASEEGLSRYWLIMAGEQATAEIIMRYAGARLESRSLARLWHFVCTAKADKKIYENNIWFRVSRNQFMMDRHLQTLPDGA